MLKAGTFLQNRYEIISRIGSGGMADVYRARDHRLNRFVAVKVLKQEFRNDKAFLSKFRVEAQAAAGLAHSNIVNVYDVGEDRGASFIVMELVEGITLKTYIGKKGKLSVREATSIALQVAAGLEAAHSSGIVHRDVKPQNIIISRDGKAKIADFGIARAANSDTISSNAMGSVHYCAPEQTRGGYSDAKSDIYSMGITMFEMLTGRVPFDGDSTVEVALKHLQEEMPSPCRFTPEIPFAVEQIILKCTQKSPDRRYNQMSELIRDLKESLVNANGNFVVIPAVDRKAQTVLLSKEEVNQLRKTTLPSYDKELDVGAAGMHAGSGTVSGGARMYPYGGNYYQNSGYQDLRHNQGKQGGRNAAEYTPDAYDTPYRDRMSYPGEEGREETAAEPSRQKQRIQSPGRGGWEEEERGSRAEKIITLISIIAAVGIGLVILFFAGRAIGLFGRGGGGGEGTLVTEHSDANSIVEVPNLLGRTEEEAKELLKNQHLGASYGGEGNSSEYAKGQIMSQSVEGGTAVAPNTTISYTISLGAQQSLTIPELANSTEEEARAALVKLGLSPLVDTTRFSDTIAEGRVINTNPGAGSVVNPSDQVTIYISQGTKIGEVEVPQMVGHYASEAVSLLDTLGLYAYQTEVYSDTVEKGVVIEQDVAAQTLVNTGSTITLTVSLGKAGEDEIEIQNPDGVWMCNAQLKAPDGYTGEAMPVRIELVQGETVTTVYEGDTTFPFVLNVQGQPGVTSGMVHLYTLDSQTRQTVQETVYGPVNFELVG